MGTLILRCGVCSSEVFNDPVAIYKPDILSEFSYPDSIFHKKLPMHGYWTLSTFTPLFQSWAI